MSDMSKLTVRQLDVLFAFLTHWSEHHRPPSRSEIAERAHPNDDGEKITGTRIGTLMGILERKGFICNPEASDARELHKSRAYPAVGVEPDVVRAEAEKVLVEYTRKVAEARRDANAKAKVKTSGRRGGVSLFWNEGME